VRKTALLSAAFILLPLLSPAGDEVVVPALPEPVPSAPVADEDKLVLDLSDAYVLALQRNLNLQVGRYDLAIAGDGILAQTGVFDPRLDFTVSGDATESPTATQLEGAEVSKNRNTTFSLALTQLLPTGTEISVDAGSRRSETNSQFFFLNPYWGSNLNFSLTQPLLQGFGTTVNRSAIIIAKTNRDQTTAAFEQLVVGTLLDVENAYWDLVATRWEVKVKGSRSSRSSSPSGCWPRPRCASGSAPRRPSTRCSRSRRRPRAARSSSLRGSWPPTRRTRSRPCSGSTSRKSG